MSENYRCLIADEMHESIVSLLEDINVIPVYKPDISRKEIIEQIADYEVLFIRSKTRVDDELLQNAHKLRVVGRAGAGTDNIDETCLAGRNIQVINAPEGNKDAVGEQTIGILLSLLHNVVKAHIEVISKKWDREGNRGVELFGKTVGIIGYGNMGRAVAQRLYSFGCTVLAYDKYQDEYEDKYCKAVGLDEIHRMVDVVSLHIPLTDENKDLIADDFFNKFQKPIYFLNLSRGEVVVLRSLIVAMEKGIVLGAGLDVLENERLEVLNTRQKDEFDFLSKSNKVILTPHIGGWSFESYFKINQVLVNKLKHIIHN